jgi:septal ring factor EnvC (AmiA/AmiB activator)
MRAVLRATRLRLLLSCLLGLAPAGGGLAAAEQQASRAQLEQVRERIAGLQQRMRAAEGEQHELTTQLQEAEQQIGRVARRLRVLAGQLQRQQQRLDDLRRSEQAQLGQLAGERRELARQVRAAYVMGRQERLKILLNQQDPARVSRVLTYYDYVNRARARRMAEIQRRLERLAGTRDEIGREEQRLRGLQQTELAAQATLEQQQVARRFVLRALAAELMSQGEELERLRRNEGQLQELLSEIEQALADIPDVSPADQSFDRRRGQLPWPAQGQLVAGFNSPKIGGLRWDGVMIGAPEGREIRAVHHGRVAFADWLRGFGLLLIIDHGDGWMTLYGHNQSLFKEVGDWVEAGEPVALVGASGGRETAGVYFGIRHQGKPVDPAEWCQRPRGRRVG